MRKTIKSSLPRFALILSAGTLPSMAFAQDTLGQGGVTSSLGIAVQTNNHFNPTQVMEYEASGVSLHPSLHWDTRGEGSAFRFDYAGHYQHYSLSETPLMEDDSLRFDDTQLGLTGRLYLHDSFYTDVTFDWQKNDQAFGTGLSQLRRNVATPDTLTQHNAGVKLVYGSEERGRYLSAQYSQGEFDYQNNSYSDLFDLKRRSVMFEVGLRNSDQIRYLVQVQASEDDLQSSMREDSKVYRMLAGFEWQPSGKSNLFALVGGYRRDFDSQDATNGINWRVAYTYTPSDLLSFELDTNRISATGEDETAIDSVKTTHTFSLAYRMSDRWQVGASYTDATTQYEGRADGVDRDLNESLASLFLTLAFADYHDLTLTLNQRALDLTDGSIDYDQQQASLMWQYDF